MSSSLARFLCFFLIPGLLFPATLELQDGQRARVEMVEDRTDSLIVRQDGKLFRIPMEDIRDFQLADLPDSTARLPDRYEHRDTGAYREGRIGGFLFGGANAGPARETYPYGLGGGLFLEPHFARFSFWGFGFQGSAYVLPGERSRINAGSLFLYSYFDIKFSKLAYFYADLGAGGTYLQWLPADGRRWVPAATMALGWQGLSTDTIRLRFNLRAYYADKTDFSRPVIPVGLEIALMALY
ncbi:MAG: hypothetical protein HS115_03660 [Spirochaetales bacterium]|nr:hypothetical protein [Spirochaetales bacterium]